MLQAMQYSIDAIKDEVRHLSEARTIDRHQPIYTLCRYFPTREWVCIEQELEDHDFLLRDQILDLLGHEEWEDD